MIRHDPNIDILDTGFVGEIHIPYFKLVEHFGEPSKDIDHKTDVEWRLRLPSGRAVAIYNYKDGPAYCGAEGIPVKSMCNWHVGAAHVTDWVELRAYLRDTV